MGLLGLVHQESTSGLLLYVTEIQLPLIMITYRLLGW